MKPAGLSSSVFTGIRSKPAKAASEHSWLTAESSSQNRTVTQREVNPRNDPASLACMQPVVSAVLIRDYVTSYYWMTWVGGWGGLPACDEVIDASECSVERLQHNLLAEGLNCFLLRAMFCTCIGRIKTE